MAYTHIFPPSPKKYMPSRDKAAQSTFFHSAIRNNFSLSSWLLLGACLQTILVVLVPQRYALLFPIVVISIRLFNNLLITFGLKTNPYLEGSFPMKITAMPMDRDGKFAGPGKEKIAVLLLGAKSNHPMGIFAPHYKTLGKHLSGMTSELENDMTQESGFLGATSWAREHLNGANEAIQISYWRSIDDVHRFAHGPSHSKVWKWWYEVEGKVRHIGIMHELFEADAGMWENVYINFNPTLMGSTTYLMRDGKLEGGQVGDQWISPLLDASKGMMGSSLGRRGVKSVSGGQVEEKFPGKE
ncbi:hypothetical protein VTL71DRAFT_8949 [Oculimacula yallundae]|uniref:DUF3291 domain-containing protein n=1 Tax=Oculimacula yallundae TaxID=86028 RepID=A0ABR4BTB4_9HELO